MDAPRDVYVEQSQEGIEATVEHIDDVDGRRTPGARYRLRSGG